MIEEDASDIRSEEASVSTDEDEWETDEEESRDTTSAVAAISADDDRRPGVSHSD